MWIQYFLNKDSVIFSAGFQYRAVNISEYLCVLNAAGEQEAQDIAMHFTFRYYYKKHSWGRQDVSLHISVFLSFHAEKSIKSTIVQSGVKVMKQLFLVVPLTPPTSSLVRGLAP